MKIELIKPTGRLRLFKRSKYKLVEPIHLGNFFVPKGFVSDGATLPFFVLWLFDPMGVWAEAAFVHDYYLTKYPREKADSDFYDAMTELGIPKVIKKMFYYAVSLKSFINESVIGSK